MSKIKNTPKIKNPLIVAIRDQLEHRALWMYLLFDHAMCGNRDIAESLAVNCHVWQPLPKAMMYISKHIN